MSAHRKLGKIARNLVDIEAAHSDESSEGKSEDDESVGYTEEGDGVEPISKKRNVLRRHLRPSQNRNQVYCTTSVLRALSVQVWPAASSGWPTARLGPADLDSAGFSAVGRSCWVFGREPYFAKYSSPIVLRKRHSR